MAAAGAMTAAVRSWAGMARSLVIYRARPWRIAQLARFYRGIVAPGDLAFDIGAHAGNRTRALVRAGARVVALEPQRAFHAFLARDLPPEVTLLKLAAGAAAGGARLAVSRLHPTVSSLAPGFADQMAGAAGFEGVRWDASETVEVTTLDALIAAYGEPRFVKVDVEGFEAEVLAGLSRPVAWVALEALAGSPEVTGACIARLAGLGAYRFNFVPGEARAFAFAEWCDAEGIVRAVADHPVRWGDVYARLDG
jgi:FkbM family methyltransferase